MAASRAVQFGSKLKELRIHLCQTSAASRGVRWLFSFQYVVQLLFYYANSFIFMQYPEAFNTRSRNATRTHSHAHSHSLRLTSLHSACAVLHSLHLQFHISFSACACSTPPLHYDIGDVSVTASNYNQLLYLLMIWRLPFGISCWLVDNTV